MEALDTAYPRAHAPAIAWAGRQFPTLQLEPVSESNWATTYRLVGPTGTSYLKVVPEVQRHQVRRVLTISRYLQAHAPAVIAAEPEFGWILTADHGGRAPLLDEPADEILAVVRDFGALQAQAARSAEFLASFDTVDTTAMPEALLSFLSEPLQPGEPHPACVGAAYFVGEADAQRYLRLLQGRVHLLKAHIARAAGLPLTLSHGDLHAWNVAIRPNGDAVFFDWDEVAAGPAGLCLHGLFGGCAYPTVVLDRLTATGSAVDSPQGRRLEAYIQALVNGGYSTRDRLLAGLAGAMCAGEIRFLVSFGRYPGDAQRSAAADTIRSRMSDLLDLCDWLASKDPEVALACADDYELGQEWRRASRLVQDQLAHQPQRPDLLARYGALARRQGDLATAEEAYREAAGFAPDQPSILVGLARTLTDRLDLTGSAAVLSDALAIQPGHAAAQALLARVHEMMDIQAAAAAPTGWPRLAISVGERASGRLDPDTLALLADLYKKYGVVQIDGVFSAETMAGLQAAFTAKNAQHFHDGTHSHALKVGDRRYMLTMELDDVFGAPELVASSLLLPFMQNILGKECILSAYTAVISLPGSEDQLIHKDHSALFEEAGWQLDHPAFAAQVVIPLLTLDEVTGATRLFKGSQRVPLSKASGLPCQDPVVPLGSCVLLDYSVAHHGIGNRSDRVRPILNLIYSRPWFRDCRNYHIQPPLRFSQDYYEHAPEAVRSLVGWWDLERRTAAQALP